MNEDSGVNVKIGVPPQINDFSNEVTFYTNVATMELSPEDAFFRFGLRDAKDAANSPSLVRVYMTPGHLKRFAEMLNKTLAGYEATFGVIPTNPEELLTPEVRKRLGMPEK